ncbi:hypothetical protein BGW80DRAFT_1256192 [Lactifluus volemus]|nr:hypothetical protein BGW80DRAFT_1256192 [Lactifluus volemus]
MPLRTGAAPARAFSHIQLLQQTTFNVKYACAFSFGPIITRWGMWFTRNIGEGSIYRMKPFALSKQRKETKTISPKEAQRHAQIDLPSKFMATPTPDASDPFTPQMGLPGPKTSHLPELTAGEPCAGRLALLLDSDESDIRDWAQKGYLKLGRTGRQLFEVNISLDGPEVNPPKAWSANKREECLEKLKEMLEGEKERRGRTGGGRARDGLGTRNAWQVAY